MGTELSVGKTGSALHIVTIFNSEASAKQEQKTKMGRRQIKYNAFAFFTPILARFISVLLLFCYSTCSYYLLDEDVLTV